MTRHVEVAASPDVAARDSGARRARRRHRRSAGAHRGTIGGSIANNDPAADYPAAVLGLGATILTDRRKIPADGFFTGLFETALAPGEIITAVRFPVPDHRRIREVQEPGVALRHRRRVRRRKPAMGVRVAVTGAGPRVFRSGEIEEALSARFSPEVLASVSVDPAEAQLGHARR